MELLTAMRMVIVEDLHQIAGRPAARCGGRLDLRA